MKAKKPAAKKLHRQTGASKPKAHATIADFKKKKAPAPKAAVTFDGLTAEQWAKQARDYDREWQKDKAKWKKKLAEPQLFDGFTAEIWRERAQNYERNHTEAKTALEVAHGVLDIIKRENAGEPDSSIASDYGGMGFENHEAVTSTRALRSMLSALQAQVVKPRALSSEEREAVSRKAFDAYNEQGPNPWKTWDGKDVPRWEQLNDQVRAKWHAAAKTFEPADEPIETEADHG